jgi:hypothetical protein
MKEIPLTQERVAIVDDADYGELSKFKWYAHHDKRVDIWYAERTSYKAGAKKVIKMHRQILGSDCEGKIVDHWNHNGLDNRRENLRPCTYSENQQNQKTQNRATKGSKYKGVFRDHDKWVSLITVNKKKITLGYFTTEAEAANAYDKAAVEYFGNFAHLNFPV